MNFVKVFGLVICASLLMDYGVMIAEAAPMPVLQSTGISNSDGVVLVGSHEQRQRGRQQNQRQRQRGR